MEAATQVLQGGFRREAVCEYKLFRSLCLESACFCSRHIKAALLLKSWACSSGLASFDRKITVQNACCNRSIS